MHVLGVGYMGGRRGGYLLEDWGSSCILGRSISDLGDATGAPIVGLLPDEGDHDNVGTCNEKEGGQEVGWQYGGG